MKFGTVLLTLFFSACVLSGIVWLGQDPNSEKVDELIEPQSLKPGPKITKSGPQPKAVIDDREYDFAEGFVGKEDEHVFTIKNEGEAPLILETGSSTCKCTISSLGKDEVLPGESAQITLTWNPTAPDEFFSESASIRTNDPKLPLFRIEISGEVFKNIMVMPEEFWSMPNILDYGPTKYSGYIYSRESEGFEIKELKTTNPLLTAKHFKLGKTELAQVGMESGFRIELVLKSGVPVGIFNESLTIITNAEFESSRTVSVLGHRYGPVTIRPIQNSRWVAKKMGIDMGNFPASEGRTSILHLYMKGLAGKDLEIRDIEIDPEYLKFSLTPDATFLGNDSKKYVLTLNILPGTPRTSRGRQNPARVRMKTNHPKIPEMKFLVHFISR
jgi:hypothetical protein